MSRAQLALETQYALALKRRDAGEEEGSYTQYLYRQGLDKILKKCGEECFEAALAAKNGVKADTLGELNDVFYHVTVLLCLEDVPFSRVLEDLNRRCRSREADIADMMEVISARQREEEGYTAYLFREGLDKLLKKVGEAVSLLLISAKDHDREGIAREAGNLFYHLMAVMVCLGLTMDDLADELERRGSRTGNLKTFHESDHTT